MESGDWLLCSGNSRLSKLIIKTQGLAGYSKIESQISHIAGLSWITEDIADLWRLNFTGLAVFESTIFNKWAGEKGKKGVQINPYETWLENYDGEVYTRHLDFIRNEVYLRCDSNFIMSSIGTPYESGIPGGAELLLCVLGLNKYIQFFFPNWHPPETKEIHCSENEARRNDYHNHFKVAVTPNRMPPAMWWLKINKLMDVPVSEPERIK